MNAKFLAIATNLNVHNSFFSLCGRMSWTYLHFNQYLLRSGSYSLLAEIYGSGSLIFDDLRSTELFLDFLATFKLVLNSSNI